MHFIEIRTRVWRCYPNLHHHRYESLESITWTSHGIFCATDVCHAARHWYLLHSEGSCPDATEGAHSKFQSFGIPAESELASCVTNCWFPCCIVREVHEERFWPLQRDWATSWAFAWSPLQDWEGDHEGMLIILSAILPLPPATPIMLLSDKKQRWTC